jgi:hypothetical protein
MSNVSFVMSVFNRLDLTKEFYKIKKDLYPTVPLIISSGGSTDGTKEWLESLDDSYLTFTHSDERISFSESYNNGIKLVNTDKLVLVHNDMVIGKYFIENMDKLITKDSLLSYTTVEPPIFKEHIRPGKVISDFGYSFNDFNQIEFDKFVNVHKDNCELYDGSVFFMGGYKTLFEDVGYFDSFTFTPYFCEDDDFLIRTKLKGYELKTTSCSIVYHFVSQTSRFNDDVINQRIKYESNSNRNFIRKWGLPISTFHEIKYWLIDDFKYKKPTLSLVINKSIDFNLLYYIEPYFDYIQCDYSLSQKYIQDEKINTNYSLSNKFNNIEQSNIIVTFDRFTNEDLTILSKLRLVLSSDMKGKFKSNNLSIVID